MKNNTSDNEIRLKDCPFCGEKAEIKYESYGWGGNETLACVKCTKCGASSQRLNITYREKELTDKVIDLWNCRYDRGEQQYEQETEKEVI